MIRLQLPSSLRSLMKCRQPIKVPPQTAPLPRRSFTDPAIRHRAQQFQASNGALTGRSTISLQSGSRSAQRDEADLYAHVPKVSFWIARQQKIMFFSTALGEVSWTTQRLERANVSDGQDGPSCTVTSPRARHCRQFRNFLTMLDFSQAQECWTRAVVPALSQRAQNFLALLSKASTSRRGWFSRRKTNFQT